MLLYQFGYYGCFQVYFRSPGTFETWTILYFNSLCHAPEKRFEPNNAQFSAYLRKKIDTP